MPVTRVQVLNKKTHTCWIQAYASVSCYTIVTTAVKNGSPHHAKLDNEVMVKRIFSLYYDSLKHTFAYSVHCLLAKGAVTVDSSCKKETETVCGGATMPQDSGPGLNKILSQFSKMNTCLWILPATDQGRFHPKLPMCEYSHDSTNNVAHLSRIISAFKSAERCINGI